MTSRQAVSGRHPSERCSRRPSRFNREGFITPARNAVRRSSLTLQARQAGTSDRRESIPGRRETTFPGRDVWQMVTTDVPGAGWPNSDVSPSYRSHAMRSFIWRSVACMIILGLPSATPAARAGLLSTLEASALVQSTASDTDVELLGQLGLFQGGHTRSYSSTSTTNAWSGVLSGNGPETGLNVAYSGDLSSYPTVQSRGRARALSAPRAGPVRVPRRSRTRQRPHSR